MWGRLRALSSIGHEVDVLIAVWAPLNQEIVAAIEKHARNILVCLRQPMWKGLIGSQPCQVASRQELQSVPLRSKYDAALLEGDAVGAVLDNPTLRCDFRVLRTHNNEELYHQERGRIAGSPPQVRAYDWIEARRYRSYSSKLIDRCDAVWWVSVDEMRAASAHSENVATKSFWLPHFHDVSWVAPISSVSGNKVLFVGALSSSQNIEAIKWYLDNVHLKLSGVPEYQFVVAGGTDGRPLPGSLAQLERDPTCLLMKDVGDLRDVYAGARVFANTVQHGAGINSKTIHAISEGLPVVTTTAGYRGTGLEPDIHLLAADEAETFAVSIRRVLENAVDVKAMVKRAQGFLKANYDQETCLRRLVEELSNVSPRF